LTTDAIRTQLLVNAGAVCQTFAQLKFWVIGKPLAVNKRLASPQTLFLESKVPKEAGHFYLEKKIFLTKTWSFIA